MVYALAVLKGERSEFGKEPDQLPAAAVAAAGPAEQPRPVAATLEERGAQTESQRTSSGGGVASFLVDLRDRYSAVLQMIAIVLQLLVLVLKR